MLNKLPVIIWTPFAVYCSLCILVPKLRVLSWEGTDSRIGTIGHIGFATLSLVPAVVLIIQQGFRWIVFPWVVGSFIMAFLGFLLDSKRHRNRR